LQATCNRAEGQHPARRRQAFTGKLFPMFPMLKVTLFCNKALKVATLHLQEGLTTSIQEQNFINWRTAVI